MRQLNLRTFIPDIILEADDGILLIEQQSSKVHKFHHKMFHVYVAIFDLKFDKFSEKNHFICFTIAKESKKDFLKKPWECDDEMEK